MTRLNMAKGVLKHKARGDDVATDQFALKLVDSTLECILSLLNFRVELSKDSAVILVLRVVALVFAGGKEILPTVLDVLLRDSEIDRSGSDRERDCLSKWLLDRIDFSNAERLSAITQKDALKEAVEHLGNEIGCAPQESSVASEAIGRLWESMLDYSLRLSDGVWSKQKVTGAKKKGGNFYTPGALASVCVERALGPLVYEQGNGHQAVRGLRDILSLKVLDPACGGGAFLIAALDYLSGALKQAAKGSPEAHDRLIGIVARKCLYGVDLCPVAAEVTRLALWLKVEPGVYRLPAANRFLRIKCGNSLIGAWKSQIETYPPSAWKRKAGLAKQLKGSFAPTTRSTKSSNVEFKTKMDAWAAYWFWPSACDHLFPQFSGSKNWRMPSVDALAVIDSVVSQKKFFHWELEFPKVFAAKSNRDRLGFDAIVSNPPWEIEKPNSREFFSRFDSEYWTYGKQSAILRQKELFDRSSRIKEEWEQHVRQLKLTRRWLRYARATSNEDVPYRLQSLADANAYKMFVEQSLHLLKSGGRLGMILPSNIYTDQGTTALRKHMLRFCSIDALLSFENRDATFPIHRSFKFCIFVASEGGTTRRFEATFAGTFSSWKSRSETMKYSRDSIERFSPRWNVFLELAHHKDLDVLEKIYDRSLLVGGDAVSFKGVVPSSVEPAVTFTREFDMTNDSALFHLREEIENQGFVSDTFGNWLKGRWRTLDGGAARASRAPDSSSGNGDGNDLFSVCGRRVIDCADIEAVALPVYEGRMVGQFDISQKGWHKGKGRRAQWLGIEFADKVIRPQYLMRSTSITSERPETKTKTKTKTKIGFLSIGSATNSRSMISTVLSDLPCGNSVGVLRPHLSLAVAGLTELELMLVLSCCFNSFVFDFALRTRLGGTNLNYFVLEECPLPDLRALVERDHAVLPVLKTLACAAARLTFVHRRFAGEWLALLDSNESLSAACWATQSDERLKLRCTIESLVAFLYGISVADFEFIMRECELPVSADSVRFRTNPKGFWRVDKTLEPEDRLTVQSLRAFQNLSEIGFEDFQLGIAELGDCLTGSYHSNVFTKELLAADHSILGRVMRIASLGQFVTLLIILCFAFCPSVMAQQNGPGSGLIAVIGSDNKTTMEDGKSMWESLSKQIQSWKEYRCDVSLTLFKGDKGEGGGKEASSRVFWRNTDELRIEVINSGFKSGSVMVKHKDGHVRIHGGPLLAFVKLTVDPDSRLLKMENGRNVTKATIPNLVSELTDEMKNGLKCLVSSSAEVVEGLPPVLEVQLLNPDGTLNARILVTSDKHIPVRWERFNQGKRVSLANFSRLTVDCGLADNLFQLD